MKILVTGAKGMVGTALCNNLKNIRDGKNRTSNIEIGEIYEYDLDSTAEELDDYCSKADYGIVFSGVRHFICGQRDFKSSWDVCDIDVVCSDTVPEQAVFCAFQQMLSDEAVETGNYNSDTDVFFCDDFTFKDIHVISP